MARLYGREWSREELLRRVGRVEQIGGVKLVEALEGTERGTRAIEVRTGPLDFTVLPDRAFDISSFSCDGTPLVWSSPVGEAAPAFYEPAGLGWLRTFSGGLVVTCGLDQVGAPSVDQGEELGLDGRIASTRARQVSHGGRWIGDEYVLFVTGEVRQARLFGENLVLRRSITTSLGSSRLRIADTVTNEGWSRWPHMILYHFNLGFPLVAESARLRLEVEETLPRDADAEAGAAAWSTFEAPARAYREQVFRHVPVADESGEVRVEVENPEVGVVFALRYARAELPHLFEWKMMGEGAYVLGLEPANSSAIEGRAAARGRGDLPYLEPGETRSYTLEVEVRYR